MTIIFDEIKYAEDLLVNGFTKDSFNFRDLCILAKYYRYLGDSEYRIRMNLRGFSIKYFPGYNEVLNGNTLDSAVRRSKKRPIKIFRDIIVTIEELNNIRELDNYKLEKILFIMLVIAKNNRVNSNHGNYYVSYKFSTILALAKVYVTAQERNNIKHYLYELEKITVPYPFDKFNSMNDNFQLLYVNDNSGSAILVSDYKDIVNFYPNYCDECKKPITRKYRQHHNLCDDCYKEKKKIDSLNRVQIFRHKIVTN